MAHELSLYPLGRTGGSYFQVISSWRTGLGSKTGVRVNFGRMWRKSGRTDVPKFGGFGYMLIGNMRGSYWLASARLAKLWCQIQCARRQALVRCAPVSFHGMK
ncbi:hypothetical protein BV22DRAFT_189310 [Leucogyrophana mollusca]|uniref:Uncharacterized protein n=1 Tax=Leucogyrophana mollusca TaxID=85980 RepID=A0ACB8BTX2_9AGAM|nr:hypothetical protein BV22DRAFT_189310 [Leucogyrophana mollusca]